MNTLDTIEKTREYLSYLTRPVQNVRRAWVVVGEKCADMRCVYDDFYHSQICVAIAQHDSSKLSEHEFVQYRRAFYPTEHETKGADFDDAWTHHKECNAHHWETWTAETDAPPWKWEVDCVHMVLDWMAMSYELGGSAKQYYEDNREKIHLPDHAVSLIYEIFDRTEVAPNAD